MALKVTRWSPDTCDCILEYEWDDAVPEDQRTHSVTTIVRACAAHTAEPDKGKKFTNVLEENQRKNITEGEMIANVPTSFFDLDADSGTRVWKKGITFNWQWTGTAPNRILAITITGATLTTNQRNAIQAKIDSKFGAGKVVLQ